VLKDKDGMEMKNSPHKEANSLVLDFLQGVLPFSDLDAESRRTLARDCSIDFIPKGTRFLVQGKTRVDYLYLIQRGGVKLYLTDEEGRDILADFRGEGSYVGALALIRNSLANLNVETIEDSFFIRIKKERFVDLVNSNPLVAQYYLKAFSESYLNRALVELRQGRLASEAQNSIALFSTKLKDMVRRPLLTVEAEKSIQEAAEVMRQNGVGSLAVTHEGYIAGIVTDKDFRNKVLAKGVSAQDSVRSIMSSPLLALDSGSSCFDALLFMMREQIHHLGLSEAGKIRAMISSHDFMLMQGRSPFSLFKDILNARSYDSIYELSGKIPRMAQNLFSEGIKAINLARMISVLNDLILERLLILLQEELGPPPARFVWLLLGSEGRKEQTLRTDQDNALLYEDVQDAQKKKQCAEYFSLLGQKTIEHLVNCGYPRCPGEVMASNPKWNQSYSEWEKYFKFWIAAPEPDQVLHSTIFFDFRSGYGAHELATGLRESITPLARREDVFLRYLAEDCLSNRPPLTFFRNFMVEKDGENKNTLDLKTRGLVPLIDFARLMALKYGITETNTLDRLQFLSQAGEISEELYLEIVEAYEFMMQLRLGHQLRLLEEGKAPDNHINPAEFTELEKRTLKEAFGIIGRVQAYIRDAFRLNI
jgi:CBS domain-containing protein